MSDDVSPTTDPAPENPGAPADAPIISDASVISDTPAIPDEPTISDTSAIPDEPAAPAAEPLPEESNTIVFAAGPRVKIIGVGDAGISTLARLHLEQFPTVSHIALNTDAKSLSASTVPGKIAIGRTVTRGLSAGGDPVLGRKSAEADIQAIEQAVADADLVFLLTGLGGGTGSGVAPLIAAQASRSGAMVIAFAIIPFSMEGARRSEQALSALARLRLNCEAVIPIYNDLLLQASDDSSSALDEFHLADTWIERGISALCSMLFKPGLIHIDFAALRGVFPVRDGKALFSLGRGQGEDGITRALEELFDSPLLYRREVRQANALVVNIQSGPEMKLSMSKINEIVGKIVEKFGGRENTVLGAVIDANFGNMVEFCIIGSSGGVRQPAQIRPVTRQSPAPAQEIPPAGAVPPGNPAPIKIEPETSPAKTIDAAIKNKQAPSPGTPPATPKEIPKSAQVELDFERDETRGTFFENVGITLIEGQDVDIPAYFRRGIKILL